MKRCLWIIFVSFLVMLLAACQPALTPSPAASPTFTGVHLKVQLVPYLSYAPLYIAQQEGYFAEQGLQVELLKMQGGEAFVALVRGEIDVVASFISSTNLSAVYRGENVRIVADKGYVAPEGCAVNGLLARKALVADGKLSKVEDMLGKKVKFDKTSIQAYYMDKLLGSAGLTFDDIEQVDFNSSAVVLQAFETGAVDLAIESEPWITQNLNTGNSVLWKDMKELIPNFQFADILYGPSILEKDPEAGKRFMVAYLKAIRQYNQGKTDRNMQLMKDFTGLDETLLKQVCWPTFRDNLLVDTQSVLDFQDWAFQQGLLDGKVEIGQIWDPTFAEYALSVVGK